MLHVLLTSRRCSNRPGSESPTWSIVIERNSEVWIHATERQRLAWGL